MVVIYVDGITVKNKATKNISSYKVPDECKCPNGCLPGEMTTFYDFIGLANTDSSGCR